VAELGMAGLAPRLAAARETLAHRAGAQTPLSARELEVLRLVAEGLSDAEIAARLYLSRRTVNSHLTSIYGKLGVASRTQALRAAAELGVL
jgi:DNA-binding CsgD family transcriptional regulator